MSCITPIRLPVLLVSTLLAGTLGAQKVLPSAANLDASTEGNSSYIGLFSGDSGQHRLQQIEEDLNTPGTFRSLSLRRDGFGTFSTSFPRVAEIELVMGLGTHDNFTTTFDSNYRTLTRVVVYDRNFINLPDARTPPAVPPAPFLPAIPFDRPYVFNATGDLIWEIVVYTTFPYRTPYPLDAHGTPLEQTLNSRYGVGCVANPTPPVLPMGLYSGGIIDSPNREVAMSFFVDRGPPNRATALLWSANEQRQTIPGLCTNLYVVDPVAILPMPNTNSAGTSTLNVTVPFTEDYVGLVAFCQAFSLDPNQPFAIPLAASNGTRVEVVEPQPRVKVISAPMADMRTDPDGIDHGFGVVALLNN